MERISLLLNEENSSICLNENRAYFIDFNMLKNQQTFVVKKNVSSSILIKEIKQNCNIDFILEEDSNLVVKGLVNGEGVNVNIHSKNAKNSSISMHFIDFSTGKSNILVNADMDEKGAIYNWQMASLAANNDNKTVKVNVEHNSENLYGDVSNYGVCKDASKLEIAGTTHIANKAKNTITKQNAKIMLIDQYSRGIAKPILKIDENDVKANHGASLGQLNEEHLFYLTSRGLSEAEAKKLIILGYFNQIVVYFKDEDVEDYILNLIGERV